MLMQGSAGVREASRGQVLPLWILGVLTMLVLTFGALNYGNTLRWNIRAQNAADSAANAALMIQTERWNEMNEALYAANVEEYRIRRLLNGILLAANNSGQCANYANPSALGCHAVYQALVPRYLQATQRYTADVILLHRITANATYANWLQDANAMLAHLQKTTNCNNPKVNNTAASVKPDGGDCAFTLTLAGTLKRTGLRTVQYNAYTLLVPSAAKPGPEPADTENPLLWAPLQVDVVACAKVQPLIPSFWKYQAQPFYAVARSAETAIMSVEEWFEPGALLEEYTNPEEHFQNSEQYVTGYPAGPYDWYAVDFGGNAAVANAAAGGFAGQIANDELSVRLGWWNAIPQKPFAPAPVKAAVCPP